MLPVHLIVTRTGIVNGTAIYSIKTVKYIQQGRRRRGAAAFVKKIMGGLSPS